MRPIGEPEGLSSRAAAARLAEDGTGRLPTPPRRTLARHAAQAATEPMTALLLVCGGVYLVVGDRQDAAVLLGFVGLIVGLTLYQERRTDRAVEALRELTSPRALVVRDGRQVRIAGHDVVRDDLLVLREGDRIAADGRIVETTGCAVDESLLTGEAAPVRKAPWAPAPPAGPPAGRPAPGGEDTPYVHAGTLVVQGAALARVTATGPRTALGAIGRDLAARRAPEPTRLQRETARLVWRLAAGAGATSALVVIAHGLVRGDWLGGLLAGLTLAMAILPNELPVVVGVFLALGAWRLARKDVLTRRVAAVEALGAITVLCVDKTGTLTQNRMTVSRLAADGATLALPAGGADLPDALHALVEYAVLASRSDPFDPMEVACARLAGERLVGTEHLHPGWRVVREYPLTRARLAVTQVWDAPGRQEVACKGAPEAVAALCGLADEARAALLARASDLARGGCRVLAVARGVAAAGAPLPEEPAALGLRIVGLVGLEDPVRPTAASAIADCRAAGIRVIMITGDHPATAASVATQLGLSPARALTGDELEGLDDATLRARLAGVEVCARIQPAQKLRLVAALRAAGEVVAMTGDGVNDAPAIAAADVGIAMGGRGTDVAREAAQLVLLDDDVASIELAVRTGRRIHGNLRRALAYLVAIHLPVLGLTVMPILLGWPLVLLPVHVAFLHVVIDPACAVVFEAEPPAPDAMRRPPRRADAPLFDRALLALGGALGASVTAAAVGAFAAARALGRGEREARAMAFTVLVLANLALIVTSRAWLAARGPAAAGPPGPPARNPARRWIVAGTLAMLAAVLGAPPLRAVFRLDPLGAVDLATCAGAAALGAAWAPLLALRRTTRRRGRRGRA